MPRRLSVSIASAGAMLFGLLAASFALATPADLSRASSGGTYFNRPGADPASHDADLKICLAVAENFSPLGSNAWQGVVQGLLAGLQNQQAARANIENCMVARRWRVIRLPDDEAAELAKLDHTQIHDRLAAWVGSQAPPGEIVRVWDNDASNTTDIQLKTASYFAPGRSISMAALSPDDFPAVERPRFVKPKLIMKGLDPRELSGAPPEASIVVVSFVGGNLFHGHAFAFGRQVSAGAQPEVLLLGKPRVYAVRVNPGVWRLEGILGTTASLSLCLGSPAFEIGPGEVVFAGTFNVYGESLGPDMSPGPAKEILASAPELLSRLRPAHWQNGSTAPCSLNTEFYSNVYAYDAPIQ